MLAALLLAALAAAPAAWAQDMEDAFNVTLLAEEIRRALQLLGSKSLGASAAADALERLSSCVADLGLRAALGEAAEQLRSGAREWPPRGLAQELAAAAARGLLSGCRGEDVYEAMLALLSAPSPVGLLPSDPMAGAVVETLAAEMGGGDVEGLVAACGSSASDAALIAAAVATDTWRDGAPLAARGCRGCSSLCRAAALLAEKPVEAPGLAENVTRALGLQGMPPWSVWERLVEMYRGGRRVEAAAAAAALQASWPSYSGLVAAAVSFPRLSLAEGAATLRAVLAGDNERAATSPWLMVSLLAARAMGAAGLGEWPGSGASPYCAAADALEKDVLNGNATPYNGLVEMLGAAASLCVAAADAPGSAARALRLNPFTPLDPWLLSLGDPVLEGLVWSGDLEAAARSGGGSAAARAAALNALLWRSSLRIPVSQAEARNILDAAGFDTPREALLAVLEIKPAEQLLLTSRGDPVKLGMLARAASLRPMAGDYVLDYASARVVAWVLVKQASINFPNIVAGSSRSPIDPYYVIFTVPGRQRLILWSLGWVTTTRPPAEQGPGAAPEEQEQRQGLENLEELLRRVAPGRPGAAALTPGEAAELLRRASELAAAAGLEEAARALEEAARGIETGDYASAAAALQRARSLIEDAAEAFARAAEEEGLSPEEAARLIASALGLALSGGDKLRVRLDTGLMEQLLEAARGAAGAAGEGGSPAGAVGAAAEELARSQIRAARRVLGSGRPPLVVEVAGLQRLIEAGFVDLTRVVAAGGGAAGAAAGAQASGASGLPAGGLGAVWAVLVAAPLLLLLAARRTGLGLGGRVAASLEALRLRAVAGRAGDERRLFAALLAALGRVYRERRSWETAREYASALPRGLREAYMEAVEAFEEARYGGRRAAVERLRESVARLAGVLRRGPG